MPFIKGKYYMNPQYGHGLERSLERHRAELASSQQSESQNSGAHWVTIEGRQVLIQEAQQEKSENSEPTKYSIEAQNGIIWLYDGMGKLVGTYHYTTGRNGDRNPAHKNTGPLPPGEYTIDPSKMS